MQSFLNKEINKYIGAGIILIVAVSIGVYIFLSLDITPSKFNSYFFIISFLFAVIVAGFVLLALDLKGKNITTLETDNEISNKLSNLANKKIFKVLLNLYLVVLSILIIWALWISSGSA